MNDLNNTTLLIVFKCICMKFSKRTQQASHQDIYFRSQEYVCLSTHIVKDSGGREGEKEVRFRFEQSNFLKFKFKILSSFKTYNIV